MQLTTVELKLLFANWADIMRQEKDKLIDLDSIVGDGDLGLTMNDGFNAAYQGIKESAEQDIGKFCYTAGKIMSTAVPSTMGTLMASGLMQVGKVFKGQTTMTPAEFGQFFAAFFDGVQARGHAKVGEKTFLDGLYLAVQTLQNASNDTEFKQLAQQAYQSAQQGVQATQNMIAVHGRAATRGEQSRTLLDPGAYVASLLLQGYVNFADQFY